MVVARTAVLQMAELRGLQRTLQALLREGLLQRDHVMQDGRYSWLALWGQHSLLRCEHLELGAFGSCQLGGPLVLFRPGHAPVEIAAAAELLICVAASLPGGSESEAIQRLAGELSNSTYNDALCLEYREGWRRELRVELAGKHTQFVAAVRHAGLGNPCLLLEQWGSLGHPWHPNFKSKMGLTPEDVQAMSPEFQADIGLQLAAIRADKTYSEGVDGEEGYAHWFARHYPAMWLAWCDAVRSRQLVLEDYLPLPVHPYQAQSHLPEHFSSEIRDQDLVLLTGLTWPASPTMSFRTVVPDRSSRSPHIKLPISLRLTSVQRTVSPKSAVMGPRISRLLRDVIKRERGFEGCLDFVEEAMGLHYLEPDGNDDRARHVSVLYRNNPGSKRTAERFPFPVGALFVESPFNGQPLVQELIALSYGNHTHGAQTFFTRYVATTLNAVVGAYMLYGIAFEAHQQNSYMVLNERYEPVQLLVRDFGDLRIHEPTLHRSGLTLQAYRPGATLYQRAEPVRDKLLHAVLLCHLGELALLIARQFAQDEGLYLQIVRDTLERLLLRLQPRCDALRWQEERDALLEQAWPAKAFLRMRLSDTSDDVHGQMPNPLRVLPQ